MIACQRRGDFIETFSGRQFWPLDPRPEDIFIEDIAHALSCVNRFTGHTRHAYSVAQHSVYVASCVPREDALWGLLHDAAEAYISDLSRPLKVLPEFAFFREVEDRILAAVCERFGLDPIQPESVHHADKSMLWAEANQLMHQPLAHWWDKWREVEIPPIGAIPTIAPWSPEWAKMVFLNRFKALQRKELVACP